MKVSAILVHPHPGSFNHAIAETVIMALEENRHTVCLHDLIQDCLMMKLVGKLSCPRSSLNCLADGIVFMHPGWWGMPPRY